MYPELPRTLDELVRMIDNYLDKMSKSYVQDGHVFARFIKERLLPERAVMMVRSARLAAEVVRLRRFRERVSKVRRKR